MADSHPHCYCLCQGCKKAGKSECMSLAQELNIARLQTALQALTAAPDMDAQPNLANSVLQHSDTGVFSSHTTPPHSMTQHASAAADAASTKPLLFRQKANPLRNTTEQQHARSQQHLFLYPEDTPLASEQDTERHVLHSRPHAQGKRIQQQLRLQADSAAGREQTQAYTVQEPDSPVQPIQAAHNSSRTPSQNDVQPNKKPSSAKDPPAGCLYQDTTIRRTTTPSRNGRAWTHHEEITVRQIREIRHSEACTPHVPPPNCPQVMQGSLLYAGSKLVKPADLGLLFVFCSVLYQCSMCLTGNA